MKIILTMIFTLFASASLFSQQYGQILKQTFVADDLNYMPLDELQHLKKELEESKDKSGQDPITAANQNTDTVFENNMALLKSFENHFVLKDTQYTEQELFRFFTEFIEKEEKIPFYLQVLFLKRCESPTAVFNVIPVSEVFTTVKISENLIESFMPEKHRVITFDKTGNIIDQKYMIGKMSIEENTITHISFNSLIEYHYKIDEEGKFDKKTPAKKN